MSLKLSSCNCLVCCFYVLCICQRISRNIYFFLETCFLPNQQTHPTRRVLKSCVFLWDLLRTDRLFSPDPIMLNWRKALTVSEVCVFLRALCLPGKRCCQSKESESVCALWNERNACIDHRLCVICSAVTINDHQHIFVNITVSK